MITTSTTGQVRTITLDRPDRRNALTPEGLGALKTAVESATEPVIYITGRGPAFCAGADLDVVANLETSEAAEAFAAHGQAVARTIEQADAVTVAGINGAARGGGLELALACDLRIATPDATLGEPGVTFGLFGAWGGTVRLPEIVGLGTALDIGLSGRVLGAEESLRTGLVSRVVENPRSVAAELADNEADAMRVLKKRLRDNSSVGEQERAEQEAFGRLVVEHTNDLGRG